MGRRRRQSLPDPADGLATFKRALALVVLEDASELLAKRYEIPRERAERIIRRAVRVLDESGE